MNRINETIVINANNEGLAVDINKIIWDTNGRELKDCGLTTWKERQFTADEIAEGLHIKADDRGYLTFTEDDFERFLAVWLTNETGYEHKGFRWLWDKYRNYKVA